MRRRIRRACLFLERWHCVRHAFATRQRGPPTPAVRELTDERLYEETSLRHFFAYAPEQFRHIRLSLRGLGSNMAWFIAVISQEVVLDRFHLRSEVGRLV
jgi:hypothetical protein